MEDVHLYVYDLSEGLARDLSRSIGIFELNGIWHSSLVLYNKEIEYGRNGINCTNVGISGFTVVMKYRLGKTNVGFEDLMDYLSFLNHTKFKGENYNLLTFNCNVFANFLANELVHKDIPEYLLQLPQDCIVAGLGVLGRFLTNTNVSNILSPLVDKRNILLCNKKQN